MLMIIMFICLAGFALVSMEVATRGANARIRFEKIMMAAPQIDETRALHMTSPASMCAVISTLLTLMGLGALILG